MTCLCLVPLLLDEDHLQLCERLVPRLRQGDQGEDGADEEEGGVQQEDPLHPHQAGQVGECLERKGCGNVSFLLFECGIFFFFVGYELMRHAISKLRLNGSNHLQLGNLY